MPRDLSDLHEVPTSLLETVLVHRALRRDVDRLQEVLKREAGIPAGAASALPRWFTVVCRAVSIHHLDEERHLWPAAVAARPDLSETVTRLEIEHAEVEEAGEGLLQAMHGLADAVAGVRPARLYATELAAERWRRVMVRTLDYEENTVMPALHTAPMASSPLPPPVLAWALHGLDPADLAVLEVRAPALLAAVSGEDRRRQQWLERPLATN